MHNETFPYNLLMEEEGKEKNGRKIKPERTRKNQKEKGRMNMKKPEKRKR